MNTILSVILFALLAGCSNAPVSSAQARVPASDDKAIAASGRHACIANEGSSCAHEIALVCPSGFVDGCLDGSTTTHKCIAPKGASCAQEIGLVCPKNFYDGCDDGTTETHQCVARLGASCAQEIGLVCPAGFKDACN